MLYHILRHMAVIFFHSEELLFSEDLDFKCPDNISAENSQNQHIGLEEVLLLNWESRER